MKNILLTFVILFLTNSLFAQIQISHSNDLVSTLNSSLKVEDLLQLKTSKTLFVYRKSDSLILDTLQKELESVWNFSQELEFVSYEEYSTSSWNESFSFFTIQGEYYSGAYGSYYDAPKVKMYVQLWKLIKGKKTIYARIELNASHFAVKMIDYAYSKHKDRAYEYIYAGADITNWNVLFLKNSLQTINECLNTVTIRPGLQSIQSSELKSLKTNTLYFTTDILNTRPFYKNDSASTYKEKELFRLYPYNYKIVSNQELINVSIKNKNPIYYAVYVQNTSYKMLCIINSNTGKIVYSSYKKNKSKITKETFIKELSSKLKNI